MKRIAGFAVASGVALGTMIGTAAARPPSPTVQQQVEFCQERGGTVILNNRGEPARCQLPNGDTFDIRQ